MLQFYNVVTVVSSSFRQWIAFHVCWGCAYRYLTRVCVLLWSVLRSYAGTPADEIAFWLALSTYICIYICICMYRERERETTFTLIMYWNKLKQYRYNICQFICTFKSLTVRHDLTSFFVSLKAAIWKPRKNAVLPTKTEERSEAKLTLFFKSSHLLRSQLFKKIPTKHKDDTKYEIYMHVGKYSMDPIRLVDRSSNTSRWWFETCCIFIPMWGRFPFWLISLKRIETTNYIVYFQIMNTVSWAYSEQIKHDQFMTGLRWFDCKRHIEQWKTNGLFTLGIVLAATQYSSQPL